MGEPGAPVCRLRLMSGVPWAACCAVLMACAVPATADEVDDMLNMGQRSSRSGQSDRLRGMKPLIGDRSERTVMPDPETSEEEQDVEAEEEYPGMASGTPEGPPGFSPTSSPQFQPQPGSFVPLNAAPGWPAPGAQPGTDTPGWPAPGAQPGTDAPGWPSPGAVPPPAQDPETMETAPGWPAPGAVIPPAPTAPLAQTPPAPAQVEPAEIPREPSVPAEPGQDSKAIKTLERDLAMARAEIDRLRGELEESRSRHRSETLRMHYNMGCAYALAGDAQRAEEAFVKALESNPLDAATHYNLGVLYEGSLARKDKALQHYRRFLELAPQDPDAAKVRGWLIELE